ncbi:MAG: ATP-grasp domain-containing protein [Muribaculaceae bacterium]|nr:ATP-grasp domain-containing protein [Muribaculaceae bacterium]
MKNNILITSAGKRAELLLEFKRELSAIFPEGKVFAVDLNPFLSPACHLADQAFPVTRVTDPQYIDQLKELCQKHDIGIIVPTIDTELKVLSRNRNEFSDNGTEIMVPDEDFINTCRDKRITKKFFEVHGIRTPKEINKHNPTYPLFAKPFDGSLSTNIHIIKEPSELTQKILEDEKLIFMEYVDPAEYKEFTVDLYYGKDNLLKCIVPRERVQVRSGEVNKAIAQKNYIIEYLHERVNHLPGVRGCICMQLFYRQEDNDIIGIEINPRFGGGYPLSYYAGANFPKMIIEEYLIGKTCDYMDNWEDGTVMLRYDSQVITKLDKR